MLKEFRTFIMRGNVLDLAIGIVIGGAFGAIVNSLVKDILMPPLGLVLGRLDFSNLFIALDGKAYATLKLAQDAGAPTLNYGLFITTLISFIIIAFAVFLLVKMVNQLQRPKVEAPAAPPAPTKEELLLTEIRDLLKAQRG